MRTLIDTHVLLWLLEGHEQLAPEKVAYLEGQAVGSGLSVSAISFWEVAMLVSKGRIALSCDPLRWRELALSKPGLEEIPLDGQVGIQAASLPSPFHADPADRMIVATARARSWELATFDRRILDYGLAGHVATWSM